MTTKLIVDTHILIWYFSNPQLLSAKAFSALQQAEKAVAGIGLPSISLVEMRYLIEKGVISEPLFTGILDLLKLQLSPLKLIPLEIGAAEALKLIPRNLVPDMPDRIIAATAVYLGLPLVTKDQKIIASGISFIW